MHLKKQNGPVLPREIAMTLSLPHRTEPFTRNDALQLAWRVLLVVALALLIASPAYAESDEARGAASPATVKDEGAKLDPDKRWWGGTALDPYLVWRDPSSE